MADSEEERNYDHVGAWSHDDDDDDQRLDKIIEHSIIFMQLNFTKFVKLILIPVVSL